MYVFIIYVYMLGCLYFFIQYFVIPLRRYVVLSRSCYLGSVSLFR